MKKIVYFLALVVSICLISCEKEEPMSVVEVSLSKVDIVSSTIVKASGIIETKGVISGVTNIEYGVAIATQPNSDIRECKIIARKGQITNDANKWPLKKDFTILITDDLEEGTTYYVRAMAQTDFIINLESVVLGNELTFTIPKTIKTPTFKQTGIITDITSSSANVTYQIESKGKSNITEYGVELSSPDDITYIIYENASSTDQDKLVSQPITFAVTYLQPNTLYYVRAYAENSYGTGYSETWTFRTAAE